MNLLILKGDFNLAFLDLVEDFNKDKPNWNKNSLRWCGNANELNGSYAADGYARVKQVSSSSSVSRFDDEIVC